MANTPVEILYTSLKSQYEPGTYQVRYPYVFDAATIPYLYMYEVDDPRIKGVLCDDRGGVSRITVGIIHSDFIGAVDGLESVIAFIETLRGPYSPIKAWNIKCADVRDLTGLEQSEGLFYRREVDVLISWGTT